MKEISIYFKRRKKLARLMQNNSIVILEAATEKTRNNDSLFRYRQCSNFYYLTGYNLPNAVLFIIKKNNKLISHFFTKKPNKHDEVWSGKLDNSSKICKTFSMDKCNYIDNINTHLDFYLKNCLTVCHSLDKLSNLKQLIEDKTESLQKKYRQGAEYPSKIISLNKMLHKIRLIKSSEEISQIKKACDISVRAHKDLMKACRPGLNERQLEAGLIHEFRKSNATEAYTSIVASGKNACTLHYIQNNSTMKDGDLLLTDAAAEYMNYASDITRTIPVNGKFTDTQKSIYNIVLDAQKNAIKKCKIGNNLANIHSEAIKILTRGLIKLGLLKGKLENILKKEGYKKFYMHNTGHWMGLDVHDPSEYSEDKKPIKLKAGMIFTVEPGLYIKADNSVPKKFHNIGIRIEDDILITKKGPVILTSGAPKDINDIERQMQ